ncbi:MAG: VWA domain-containing protein [Blastocatellales bacterium]
MPNPIIYLLILFILPVLSRLAPHQDPRPQETIRVDTSLVTLPVIVKDPLGQFVQGLSQRDFRIQEDGIEQQIAYFSVTDEPVNVALLLDASPSTKEWMDATRKYATEFIKLLRPQDRVLVVAFGERVTFSGDFTSNRRESGRAIGSIRSGIATALYDAIEMTIREKFSAIQGRKAMVVFTDGDDSWSRRSTAESALEAAVDSGIPCYVVQYWQNPRGSRFLPLLAYLTGALHMPAPETGSAREAFRSVSGELRNQYTLAYYPLREGRDGEYRKVAVSVDRPGVRVRTRQGYRSSARR